jgi:hypothetical protein
MRRCQSSSAIPEGIEYNFALTDKKEDVMKRETIAGVMFTLFFATTSFCTPTQIRYETSELGAGRWQYSYDVRNINLTAPIEEFTIWFDYGLYDNLAVETPNPPASNWSEIVLQPEPVLQDDGAYDAKALNLGISIGQIVGGFAVSFDWLGTGEPGTQFYEIIDPTTFETIDSGWTIPEPATILLFGLGGLVLRRRK